jgi:hypothetical protein
MKDVTDSDRLLLLVYVCTLACRTPDTEVCNTMVLLLCTISCVWTLHHIPNRWVGP